jgi:hypothetical protein
MKKAFGVLVFAVILGEVLCAQSWTRKWNNNSEEYEYTLLTKEEFNRLKRQYETSSLSCLAYRYETGDTTILIRDDQPVIKGQIPRINGYYYILMQANPDKLQQWRRDARDKSRPTDMLYYGYYSGEVHRSFSLTYYESDMTVGDLFRVYLRVNSVEYQTRISQLMGFVEG